MISADTLKFLRDLAKHNDRDWFQDHRSAYESARGDFEGWIERLIHELSEFDPSVSGLSAKKCIFRIHRDIRFSKDKSPYKTHFGAHLSVHSTDFHDHAGYYVHIEPKLSMLGGGAYMPSPKWLAAIRSALDRDSKPFRKILKAPSFQRWFGTLEGEALKTVPKGFAADHPDLDLLKHKSFLAIHRPKDADLSSPNFLGEAVKAFKALKPLNDFLNAAAAGVHGEGRA
jgi:uncharacterized protein (TIGR02453 family)